jgi:hypothetical protein
MSKILVFKGLLVVVEAIWAREKKKINIVVWIQLKGH